MKHPCCRGVGLPAGLLGARAEPEVVGADRHVGELEPPGDVGVQHQEVDHRDLPVGLEEEVDQGVLRRDPPVGSDLGHRRPSTARELGDTRRS